jgi:hypothetical protein
MGEQALRHAQGHLQAHRLVRVLAQRAELEDVDVARGDGPDLEVRVVQVLAGQVAVGAEEAVDAAGVGVLHAAVAGLAAALVAQRPVRAAAAIDRLALPVPQGMSPAGARWTGCRAAAFMAASLQAGAEGCAPEAGGQPGPGRGAEGRRNTGRVLVRIVAHQRALAHRLHQGAAHPVVRVQVAQQGQGIARFGVVAQAQAQVGVALEGEEVEAGHRLIACARQRQARHIAPAGGQTQGGGPGHQGPAGHVAGRAEAVAVEVVAVQRDQHRRVFRRQGLGPHQGGHGARRVAAVLAGFAQGGFGQRGRPWPSTASSKSTPRVPVVAMVMVDASCGRKGAPQWRLSESSETVACAGLAASPELEQAQGAAAGLKKLRPEWVGLSLKSIVTPSSTRRLSAGRKTRTSPTISSASPSIGAASTENSAL